MMTDDDDDDDDYCLKEKKMEKSRSIYKRNWINLMDFFIYDDIDP